MNSQTRTHTDFFFDHSSTKQLPFSNPHPETYNFDDQSTPFSRRQAQDSEEVDSYSEVSDAFSSNQDFIPTLQQRSLYHTEGRAFVQLTESRRLPDYLISFESSSQSQGHQLPPKRKSNICLSRENIMRQWTEGDDAELMSLADQYKNDWKKIARRITSSRKKKVTPNFLKNRYKEIAGDHIKKGVKFTHEEDLEIARLFEIHGTSWTHIAHQFKDRTPVMIKNRYYSHIRRKGLLQDLVYEALGKSKSSDPSEECHEFIDSPDSLPQFQNAENQEPEYDEMIGNDSLDMDERYSIASTLIGSYPNNMTTRFFLDDEGLCNLQNNNFEDDLKVRVTDPRYPEHNFQ